MFSKMNFKSNLLVTCCIVACIVVTIDLCYGKTLVPPTTPASGTRTTRRSYSCSCSDSPEPVCANNGVTYDNMCRFECAAHKIENLRVVKEGNCGKYMSKLNFYTFGK